MVSLTLYISSFFAYITIVLGCYLKCYINHRIIPVKNSNITLLYFSFVLLGIFGAFTGDFPTLIIILNEIYAYPNYLTHLEPIYVWICEFVKGDIYLWRCFIAIISFTSFFFILKESKTFNYLSLLIFGCVELFNVINGRQQCSIFIFFLGFIIFLKNNKILGIILILISIFFHKSGFLSLLLLSLIAIKLSKRKLIFSLATFPIMVIIENIIFKKYFLTSDEIVAGSAYFTAEDFDRSFLGTINYYGRIFLAYMISILTIYKVRKIPLNNINCYLSRFLFWSIYATSLLYFLPIKQMTLFDRSMQLWWIPVIILANSFIRPEFRKNRAFIGLVMSYFILTIMYLVLSYRYQSFYYYDDLC